MKCTLCGSEVVANDQVQVIKIRALSTYSNWALQQGEPESRTKHFWCDKHYNSFMAWYIRESEHGEGPGTVPPVEGD